jgi:hypothetical protein
MTSPDTATTTLISQEPTGRSFDEEQMAAASFLARYTAGHSRRIGTTCAGSSSGLAITTSR